MSKKMTSVEWFFQRLIDSGIYLMSEELEFYEQAKQMEKEQMLDFGEFIIDELEPMAQSRDWVEERYNYFTEGE